MKLHEILRTGLIFSVLFNLITLVYMCFKISCGFCNISIFLQYGAVNPLTNLRISGPGFLSGLSFPYMIAFPC